MTAWRTVDEVMRDLAIAAGGPVEPIPASHVLIGDGPPPNHPEEDVNMMLSPYDRESDFLAGGDTPPPADFREITQMLQMVRDAEDPDDPISCSMLNPLSPEFVPAHLKKEKNVMSPESAAKWPMPTSMIPLMFKRKSVNSTGSSSQNVSPSHSSQTSQKSQTSQTSSPDISKKFIPSPLAGVLLSTFVERHKLKEEHEKEIGAKKQTQKKSKKDARKKLELEPEEPAQTSSVGVPHEAFDIKLAVHRHQMPGDCVVCIVAAKRGYYF